KSGRKADPSPQKPINVPRTADVSSLKAGAFAPEVKFLESGESQGGRFSALSLADPKPAVEKKKELVDVPRRSEATGERQGATLPSGSPAVGESFGSPRTPAVAGRRVGMVSSSALERAISVRDAVEVAPTPASTTVQITGPGDDVHRVTVRMVDRDLSVLLSTKDPLVAARIRGRVQELYRALEGRGIESASVAVQGRPDPRPEAAGMTGVWFGGSAGGDAIRSLLHGALGREGEPQSDARRHQHGLGSDSDGGGGYRSNHSRKDPDNRKNS
ncbi:MAG: hypothetical protein ACE5GJ_14915, partial [Gemmatimonadota bacterium]